MGVRDRFDGRAVALVDLWNRGVLDVVVANQRGPLLLYRNTVRAEANWIGFELIGQQCKSQCHWGAGAGVLEWRGAGAGGVGRQRLCRAESTPAAFWVRRGRGG